MDPKRLPVQVWRHSEFIFLNSQQDINDISKTEYGQERFNLKRIIQNKTHWQEYKNQEKFREFINDGMFNS